MINLQIRQFRDSIIAIINTNPLPIEVKRLVFEELRTQIDLETEKILQIEKEEAEKENANE